MDATERNKALAQLRGLNEMLKSDAWLLLDKHWELQELHNQTKALDEKLMPDTRAIALGAYKAIQGMRAYAAKQLPLALKNYADVDEKDLQSE